MTHLCLLTHFNDILDPTQQLCSAVRGNRDLHVLSNRLTTILEANYWALRLRVYHGCHFVSNDCRCQSAPKPSVDAAFILPRTLHRKISATATKARTGHCFFSREDTSAVSKILLSRFSIRSQTNYDSSSIVGSNKAAANFITRKFIPRY
jgi:hypothetical protein